MKTIKSNDLLDNLSPAARQIVSVVSLAFYHYSFYKRELTHDVVCRLYYLKYDEYFADFCSCVCDHVSHGVNNPCAEIIDMSKQRALYQAIDGTQAAKDASEYFLAAQREHKEDAEINAINYEIRKAREEITNKKNRDKRESELDQYRKEAKQWRDSQ